MFRGNIIIIWLTIEHSKLGRSATNIRCEDMELESLDQLSPSRAGDYPTKRKPLSLIPEGNISGLHVALALLLTHFTILMQLSPTYFCWAPLPTKRFPSLDIIDPESSHMKNLAGVLTKPEISMFRSPVGQPFLVKYL